MSKARAVTISARVESSPPEMPTTALFDFILSSLDARALLWMLSISSQRSAMSPFGRNGFLSYFLSSFMFLTGSSMSIFLTEKSLFGKEDILRLSKVIVCRSASAKIIPGS